MTDTLTAKVQQAKADSVFYYRAANQWSIFKTDRGKCLGVLPFDINAGDPLSMKGKWKRSDYNGEEEFHFTDVVLDVPTDLRALLTYAVEITNGLGPAAEEKIWEQYGEEWRGVEVLEIPGIQHERVDWAWKDTLERLEMQQARSKSFAFLLSKGVTMRMAGAAFEKWKEETMSVVIDDPFILAELPHYGFAIVDNKVRRKFGVTDDDPRRGRAAVMYCAGQLAEKHGTAICVEDLNEEYQRLGCGQELGKRMMELIENEELVLLTKEFVALMRHYNDEQIVMERFGMEVHDECV